MKSIPLYLLNMTATLYPYTGQDDYANPTYGAAVTIGNIYIEQTKAVTLGGLGETGDGTISLFFDGENSTPEGMVFKNLDKIVFDSVGYLIRQAVPYRNPMTGLIHHWEISLYGN
jgi:hypothetical protein